DHIGIEQHVAGDVQGRFFVITLRIGRLVDVDQTFCGDTEGGRRRFVRQCGRCEQRRTDQCCGCCTRAECGNSLLGHEFTFQECRTVGGSTNTRMPVTRRCRRQCRAGASPIHPGRRRSRGYIRRCSLRRGNCCRARCGSRPCRDHRRKSSDCWNAPTAEG